MTMQWVVIDPHDVSIFRDGRPFNQNDEGMSMAVSQFPPSPRALAMAVRVALARGEGWRGGNWCKNGYDAKFSQVLGDGPDTLGELKFHALFLYDMHNQEVLYPAPLSLVARMGENEERIETLACLQPGEEIATDIGPVRLPKAAEGGGWKTLEGWFISSEGMQTFLNGETPDKSTLLPHSDMINTETHIGIGRDYESRTTSEGQIFSASLKRLGGGLKEAPVQYGYLVGYSGAEDWKIASCQPVGGESRFAWFSHMENIATVNNQIEDQSCCVLLITPMQPSNDQWRTPGGKLEDLPGKIVTACVGKPTMLGGWTSDTKKFGPLPLKPHIPAGSVFFLELESGETLSDLPKAIGQQTDFGFGGCVFGKWKKEQ